MEYIETGRSPASALRAAGGIVPWALGMVMFVLTLVDYSAGWDEPVRDSALVVYAALSAGAAGLARWHRWPLLAATAVGAVLFSSWPGFLSASYYAGTSVRRSAHVVVFACAATVALLGVPALHHALGADFPLGSDHQITATERGFSVLFLIGTPLVLGLWVGARRQVLAALAERAERLEREHTARAEQARTAERTCIAREMHDVVAHKVSLMVLHAGALEVGARDGETTRTAELIRATGREALTNLRVPLCLSRCLVRWRRLGFGGSGK